MEKAQLLIHQKKLFGLRGRIEAVKRPWFCQVSHRLIHRVPLVLPRNPKSKVTSVFRKAQR